MYSFEPSEEQTMLVDTIKKFAADLRAKAHDADEENQILPQVLQKGWELGYLQASIPADYGGFGERSAVTGALAFEEMAYGDLAGAMGVLTPGLFAVPLLLAGSEEQKRRFLPQVSEAMDWAPFSAALIESEFDFDPWDLKTTARLDGEQYVIEGEKAYVPYALEANHLIVYAGLEGKPQGFIATQGSGGLVVEDRQKLLGIHALPVYRVCFNGVRVPRGNRLGGAEGHDFGAILDAQRIATAAMGVGLSRAAYEYSRAYAKDRDVFGVKVAQKQAVAFMLAEMATEIEAIRLLTWEAAWMLDAGKDDASKHAYLALIGAQDLAMMVTDRAVQILGGHGYIREHPVEMWMRNGRGIATFTGMSIV